MSTCQRARAIVLRCLRPRPCCGNRQGQALQYEAIVARRSVRVVSDVGRTSSDGLDRVATLFDDARVLSVAGDSQAQTPGDSTYSPVTQVLTKQVRVATCWQVGKVVLLRATRLAHRSRVARQLRDSAYPPVPHGAPRDAGPPPYPVVAQSLLYECHGTSDLLRGAGCSAHRTNKRSHELRRHELSELERAFRPGSEVPSSQGQ
jgi:hypothetical protein